jgi:hypothetical protein
MLSFSSSNPEHTYFTRAAVCVAHVSLALVLASRVDQGSRAVADPSTVLVPVHQSFLTSQDRYKALNEANAGLLEGPRAGKAKRKRTSRVSS